MKLLIATDCFLPRWDGIARFLQDILPHLSDYEVTVVAPDFPGEYEPPANVRIVRIPLMKMTFGDYTPALFERKVIKQLVLENDIVWTHTLASIGGLAIRYAKKLKKPYSCYIHSIDWLLVTRALAKRNVFRNIFYWYTKRVAVDAFSHAKFLMVPSVEVAEIMRWNKIKTKCELVPLGIHTEQFIPSKDKALAKKELGIDPESFVIGYTGRFGREKDLLTLYRSFISSSKKIKNAKLLLVGDGLVDFKEHMKQNPRVILAGSQNNVIPYLHAMDIFVLPSVIETTSLSTLEAMSCALPVVCTPVGLVKEYLHEKYNGMLFPIHNSLVLSLKLEWLYEHKAMMHIMGANARKTVLEEYNWNQTVQKVKEMLGKLGLK
jgi:glycosyltransferase involved in cell wall biosynthesis